MLQVLTQFLKILQTHLISLDITYQCSRELMLTGQMVQFFFSIQNTNFATLFWGILGLALFSLLLWYETEGTRQQIPALPIMRL